VADKVLIVRIGEIHLKGLNRGFFINKLTGSIRRVLKGTAAFARFDNGYIYVRDYEDEALIIGKVTRVFGVQSVSPALEVGKDYDSVLSAALMLLQGKSGTFKVDTKRSDKSYPLTSMEMSPKLGEDILKANANLTVDLHNPGTTIYVKIREKAYVFTETIKGQGGMPLGTNGRACLLLSGGIDSPVAGYQIARRGVSLCAVYFDGFPYTSEKARQKVIDLAKRVEIYTGHVKLYFVPFVKIQQEIRKRCPESYTTVIMRRYMMRIAERIALQENALALITGESIGQVASQTLQALAATNSVVSMPVFRPLIGMDKIDIIDIARAIDTYDISALPYEDCCSIFTPKHPTTHPKLETCEEAEAKMDVAGLVDDAVNSAVVQRAAD
jgi:thiamine biosynthesis protein ThiI